LEHGRPYPQPLRDNGRGRPFYIVVERNGQRRFFPLAEAGKFTLFRAESFALSVDERSRTITERQSDYFLVLPELCSRHLKLGAFRQNRPYFNGVAVLQSGVPFRNLNRFFKAVRVNKP
jgi:hypothetical protein